MPKEFTDCVKKLVKDGKTKKEAYAICTAAYKKKHGVSPQSRHSEADKKERAIKAGLRSVNSKIIVAEKELAVPDNKIELVTAASLATAESLAEAGFETQMEQIQRDMAKAGISVKPKDLMYTTFKLAHVGTNENSDEFLDNEITASVRTPIHKLVNWQHGEPNIGCMVDSKLVEKAEGEEKHILVAGAISKYKYPELADEIMFRHEQGRLFASMETWFDKAKCSVCGQEFTNPLTYCEHLQARGDASSKWKDCSRQLIGVVFAGAAIGVDRPADKQASITQIEE